MTRKQALFRAIDALSGDPANEEAVRTLKGMVEDLPLTRWTDAAVRDAVWQYIEDHRRPPRPSDFRTKSLPPIPAFQRLYKMTVGAWLAQNGLLAEPERAKEQARERAAQTALFIREYHRIQPQSRAAYDRQRSPAAKSAQTIMRYNRAATWTALRRLLKLPTFPPNRTPHQAAFRVEIHHDFDPAEG